MSEKTVEVPVSFMDKWRATYTAHDSRYGELTCTATHAHGYFSYTEYTDTPCGIVFSLMVVDDESMIETFVSHMFARGAVCDWTWVFDWTS